MSETKKSRDDLGEPAVLSGDTAHGAEPVGQTGVTPAEEAKTPPADPAGAGSPSTSVGTSESEEWEAQNREIRRRMRRHSRRSFLGFGAASLLGLGAWRWLTTRREIDGLSWPFRQTLGVNEQLFRDYFSTQRLSPTFAPDRVSADRVNGDIGLGDEIDATTWKLRVEGLGSQNGPVRLGLEAIRKLPRVEMTTELKCIEGWSVVVQWAGARFTDFMRSWPPQTLSGDAFSLNNPHDLPPYVSMSTPDEEYYVGLEMESLLHPQTLLCYERNGAPLSQEHGAPLRLVIPVKYGVKNIKRLGTIRYSTLRPADYWAERGYDWYIGL